MSRLEQRTKPNLIALSSGARRLEGLSHPEQAILSRWAVKTAFVLHAASYPLAKIPRSVHPELQQRGDLPKGISVVAMQTPDLADDILAVTAIQSDRHVCLDAGRVSKPLGCWKISLRVGMLQLLISYCPDDRWAPLAWRGVHQPVWPTRVRLWYSALLRRGEVTVRKESGTVLFHLSLGLTSGLNQRQVRLVVVVPPCPDGVSQW